MEQPARRLRRKTTPADAGGGAVTVAAAARAAMHGAFDDAFLKEQDLEMEDSSGLGGIRVCKILQSAWTVEARALAPPPAQTLGKTAAESRCACLFASTHFERGPCSLCLSPMMEDRCKRKAVYLVTLAHPRHVLGRSEGFLRAPVDLSREGVLQAMLDVFAHPVYDDLGNQHREVAALSVNQLVVFREDHKPVEGDAGAPSSVSL